MGVTLDVLDGETLMHAAERQGLRWPTTCHGQALCTLCVIDVGDHPDAFDPPRSRELEALQLFAGRTFFEDKALRLACQARPIAHTIVTKRGVRSDNAEDRQR